MATLYDPLALWFQIYGWTGFGGPLTTAVLTVSDTTLAKVVYTKSGLWSTFDPVTYDPTYYVVTYWSTCADVLAVCKDHAYSYHWHITTDTGVVHDVYGVVATPSDGYTCGSGDPPIFPLPKRIPFWRFKT